MKSELEKLDSQLKQKRPGYYGKLQKPLSEAQILDLETKYEIKLPNDLKELYLWKNGQESSCYEPFVNNSLFEPLGEVLSGNKEFTQMIGYDFEIENWWNKAWLPIFGNGGGSYICYDIEGVFTGERGQLIEYWNEFDDRPVIAPNLLSFITRLNQYYEETPLEEFDEYFDIRERISEWNKEFIVNKPIKK
ncbi:SMI1/KNR4 family protein [Arenibacter sp. GZD96]|uniref:SMI1/KNR4 family protein n=1 Tax=Aurantibrevibacter litoralis TaxID=3106030 RepID=UPI002AFEA496|nr:SMI1/KNR4 family protein [Arenibacter sp. GZD-96]MEA1784494.1 SMI1/KNR4 family protein [Arenibacter sp. GZD-96]